MIWTLFLTSLLHAGVPAVESLNYTINWPSGLSLGEGRLAAKSEQGNWIFEFHFDAAVPGFAVTDKYTSTSTPSLCSVSFEKDITHGKRKSREKISFENGSATRETIGGGKSQLTVPECPQDALAFVFKLRKDLAAGRVTPTQDIFYGSAYKVQSQYSGTQRVRVGEATEEADRVLVTIKGPSSEFTLELFIGKDENRTPLLIKAPLQLGTFSMEIVR